MPQACSTQAMALVEGPIIPSGAADLPMIMARKLES